jgi:hypothetical protein
MLVYNLQYMNVQPVAHYFVNYVKKLVGEHLFYDKLEFSEITLSRKLPEGI